MKKLCWMLLAAWLLGGLMAPAQAEEEAPGIILYTAYRQVGWGDLVQIGCVDENGGLWRLEGHDGELGWPWGWEEQIAFLEACPRERIGAVSGEELFGLKGLIACVEPGEGKPQGWMNDAGTETSRAVRRGPDGQTEAVLLGMTGDGLYENTDPNAQALYRKLREWFPFVRCYAGLAEEWGFRAVPLRAFLNREDVSVRGARVRIWYNDCEEGILETEATEEEMAQALALLQYGWVTGKENASMVTGGTYTLAFEDDAGETICSFEMYRDLLIGPDGMYRLEARRPAATERQALTLRIGDRQYILGQSTARELTDAGWTWEQEPDGVFGFRGTKEGSWFYVGTENGALDGAIVSVNLLWADGIPYGYCGCSEDSETLLWMWLEEELAGKDTVDGLLTAYVNLPDGGTVRIETKGDRPLLTLIR